MDLITSEEIEKGIATTSEEVDYHVPCVVRIKNSIVSVVRCYRGLLLAFLSACCYAGMTLTVSALTDEVSSMELVFVRALSTLCISAIILIHQGVSIKPESLREVKFHIINAAVATTSIFCQFYAYQNMRTADASAIIYGYVAFAGLFGRMFLKEAFGFFEAFAILVTFAGTVLIARPPFIFGSSDIESGDTESGFISDILPPIMALNGSIFAALMVVVLRAMQKHKFISMKTVFHFSLYTMVLIAIPLTVLKRWSIPQCIIPRLLVLLLGFMSFAGYSLVNLAVSMEDAVYVSLVTMNEVYIVFFLDMIIFGSRPRWLSVLGTFLIVGCSAVTLMRNIFKKRSRPTEGKDPLAVAVDSNCTTPEGENIPKQFINGKVSNTIV